MSRWFRWVFLAFVGFVLASLLHSGLGTVAHATDGAESPVEESAPAVGNDSEFYPIAMSEAVDFLNSQNTPTLQSIVSCLPQRPAYLAVPKFSLLASRELNGETYHYLNVYVDHGFGQSGRTLADVSQASR
jgi:hypothetical protein